MGSEEKTNNETFEVFFNSLNFLLVAKSLQVDEKARHYK